ncbi:hypothetical protein VHUM_01904 [Vanrija humicola]|uniref:NADPH--cytochrome P450 reductase n=1 Tax=Vanrija humicola TaxID=5417 RepID=A0A7D8V2P0_VANHU|nr:hypothetical protein VHUM_01904 [Vanrija humicola]
MVSVDLLIVGVAILLPLLWWFRESLPFIGGKPRQSVAAAAAAKSGAGAGADDDDDDNPRDFVTKMDKMGKRAAVFFGTQTGTAEEYAIRLAKEAKSRFGISSLVCDPEEYDFNKLDQVPSDKAVIFVLATYGEGDPTDNAQPLFEFILEENVEFSQGSSLENLNYVIFGLGNRTYEHFNETARQLDRRLQALGAHRIGERGEGDDDKALEEDYLSWKDGMWTEFAKRLDVEEGGAGDVADFVVTEVDSVAPEKVFHGELSARALVASANKSTTPSGSYDAKNPYPAPVATSRELFAVSGERNCVHIEFDISGTGISYMHGDHVGVWPSNPDSEVERALAVLGLSDKRHTPIAVESLDPALAKVPFPTPATYESVFRHYLDISSLASRQTIAFLARYAPNEQAKETLTTWGTDREAYHEYVDGPKLKIAEVLQSAALDSLAPPFSNSTVWPIPFDRIIGTLPRLQPRYYSISSSSKLNPSTVHVTAVVLKYESGPSKDHADQPRWVYGLSTNFILNVKLASDANGANKGALTNGHAHTGGLAGNEAPIRLDGLPSYKISGPRDFHLHDNIYRVPIHIRRSTFRLPTSPKVPIIMIGPGTGVAPFRGFVQERVALARKATEKGGIEALKDWAPIYLFYGCRREDEDYLYAEEWPEYAKELGGKFKMITAFSRGPDRKPDGSKIYVQDLLWDKRDELTPLILDKRAYIYICGDAKNMARAVEDRLARMLGEAKGGTAEIQGAKELKLLKERNRFMTDVWS